HEADWDQKSPSGIDLCALPDRSQKEPDNQASREVDHEGAVRKSSPHSVDHGGPDKIPGHGAQSTPDCDKKVFLQVHLHKATARERNFLTGTASSDMTPRRLPVRSHHLSSL